MATAQSVSYFASQLLIQHWALHMLFKSSYMALQLIFIEFWPSQTLFIFFYLGQESSSWSIYNHKSVFRLTRFGLCPLICPAFIGWDCLAVNQGLFYQGYHTLAKESGFKAPDTRLHPRILWWVGFDGYAGQLPAWAFPAISRDTYSA